MSLFTKRAQPAIMMLGEASSPFCILLKYICIQILNQNIPHVSRVMSIFTKRALPAKMMLGEASSPVRIPAVGNVKIQ